TQEVPINGRTEFEIEMVSQAITGEEMVVVGYGEQSKSNITSSISSVSAEDLENQPVQQFGQALQGKVAGVQVVQSSGSPGAPLSVRIRGIGTVNSSEPLYVVDGNAGVDPADVNPNQIESIEVLKSSSAAAIYGARGANGVVLITTKKGVAGTSNLEVNYYTGIQQVHNRIDMMNGEQFATTYNKALINAGIDPLFENIGSLGKGTDWQDAVFRNASVNNVDLSINGGSEQGSYYIGGGYYQQEGTVLKSDYERLSFRVNSEYEVNSIISLGENLVVNYSKRNSIPGEYGSRSIVPQSLRMDPTVPVKNSDGSWGYPNFSDAQNPVAQAAFVDNTNTVRPALNGSIYLDFKPTNNLIYHSQVNINLKSSGNKQFTRTYDVGPLQRNLVSSLSQNESESIYWDWNNTLTYDASYGSHDIEILSGITVLQERVENISARGQDLPLNANENSTLRYLNLAPDGQVVGGGAGEYGLLSFLGRVNYNYNNTYLFTGNFRVDGSSKFGSNNRYGLFPSFSAGWRMSNENFMKKLTFIDDFKIRGGWGMLGNQNTLPNYAFVSSLTPDLVYVFGENSNQGQAPVSVANPDLKWETTTETEFGFDFTGFENRITLSGSYYYKKTSDMLLRVPVMDVSGILQPPFVNGGNIVNKGIEIALGYQKTTPGDFYYDISVNISRNTNEVTKLSNQRAAIFSGVGRTVVGGSVADFYGYKADGIFQTQQEVDSHAFQTSGTAPGDIKFKDINDDGVIDQDDRGTIGNPWPDMTYGLNSNFNWEGFDLRLSLQGTLGNDVFASWKTFTQGSNFYNYDTQMLNAWNGEGTSTTTPRLNTNDPNDNFRASSYLVEDGSYLRLKNLQVGYTIPSGFILNQINKLRIYLSAQNLLTLTNYEGYDPEVGVIPGAPLNVGVDNARYPISRTVTLGISLGIQ
ncbi:TonB-linked outer membrane protein, SusC/RagA family, partial [Fodinibius roseus]